MSTGGSIFDKIEKKEKMKEKKEGEIGPYANGGTAWEDPAEDNAVMHGVLGIRQRSPVQSLGSGPTCPILALLGEGPPRGNGKRYVTLLKRNLSL